jgi:hypothetical protein
MIPDPGERIPRVKIADWVGDVDGYLIETKSLGGISGSPVFVRETVYFSGAVGPERRPVQACAQGDIYLLGLVHGHWSIRPEDVNETRIEVKSEKIDKEAANMGIAITVPAKKIMEVLNHPELVELRRVLDEKAEAELGTTDPD